MSFQVFASQETDNTGEQVCVDFTVSGWDELVGIQFSVNWDPSQLEFASLIPNDEDIPNNILGAVYGIPGQGAVGPGERRANADRHPGGRLVCAEDDLKRLEFIARSLQLRL